MLTPDTIKAMTVTQANKALQLAYKALGLLNKLKASGYKAITKSRLFGNINRLRAAVKRATQPKYSVVDRDGNVRHTNINKSMANNLRLVSGTFNYGWTITAN